MIPIDMAIVMGGVGAMLAMVALYLDPRSDPETHYASRELRRAISGLLFWPGVILYVVSVLYVGLT